jgi:hypothetical protein
MPYILDNLDNVTRGLMLDELEADVIAGQLTTSARARPGTESIYLQLLREAFANGDADSLIGSLESSGIWATHQADGKQINVPDASKVLGDGQFVAYYCRAICLRAMADGRAIEVYRGQMTAVHRGSSDRLDGTRPDPVALLDELRRNSLTPWKFTVVGKPNSGMALRLV